MDLNYEIWAVDRENHEEALIGTCFMKGIALEWAKDCTCLNDIEVRSKSSGERWFFKKKEWK